MSTTISRRSLIGGAAGAGLAGGVAAVAMTQGDGAEAATTAATAAACATESSEQEVGPFYVAEGLVRSAITAGEDGIPLTITVTYLDPETCAPAPGLAVDVWQANAAGVYSDEQSENTVGETYLRGVQITDAAGKVTFTTIVPGWYAGRTMHIHSRVYAGGTVSGSSYSYAGATLLYTGQWFFPDDVDTAVAASTTYSGNHTTRTTNAQDRVYTSQGGSGHVLAVSGSASQGYTATLTMYVDSGATATGDEDTTSVTLGASTTTATAGQHITLRGHVMDTTTSKPVSGATVRISETIGSRTGTAKATTDAKGAWSLTLPARRTATYEATYAGDDDRHASSSRPVTVTVRYRVIVSEVEDGRPVVLRGRVSPADAGVLVTVYQVRDDGTRHAVATARTNGRGRWRAHWRASAGKHQALATVHSGSRNSAGRSRLVTVRRG